MSRPSDLGSATLELAILTPVLLVILGVVVVAGRVTAAGSAVEQASAAGARAASVARDARTASVQAERMARDSLDAQGIECRPFSTQVDTSGFAVAVGRPAAVRVRVSCGVPVASLGVPGMPGTRVVESATTSPLDRYRGRG